MRFRLDAASRVEVDVYDLRGGRVAQLERGVRGPGLHSIAWDGRDASGARLPSGVYLVRTRLGETAGTHKVTIVR
jgi:flagellar hook assembly protein FlgD